MYNFKYEWKNWKEKSDSIWLLCSLSYFYFPSLIKQPSDNLASALCAWMLIRLYQNMECTIPLKLSKYSYVLIPHRDYRVKQHKAISYPICIVLQRLTLFSAHSWFIINKLLITVTFCRRSHPHYNDERTTARIKYTCVSTTTRWPSNQTPEI